jgi:hypothetical protein
MFHMQAFYEPFNIAKLTTFPEPQYCNDIC